MERKTLLQAQSSLMVFSPSWSTAGGRGNSCYVETVIALSQAAAATQNGQDIASHWRQI